MNLIIDIGNTFCKVAVVEQQKIEEIFRYQTVTPSDIEAIVLKYPGLDRVVLSSVRVPDGELERFLNDSFRYFLKITTSTALPISNCYGTPATLGMDRLMSAVGAVEQFKGSDLLIFDLGSAITIDFVSSRGEFLGGNISPGMSMRFKALHQFTDQLPLCCADDDYSLIGRSTQEAIKGGVIVGIINEIEGYINRYLEKNDKIVIIFTGGDANYFVYKVKNTIFVDCDLLLKGLNKVLEYNYDKN